MGILKYVLRGRNETLYGDTATRWMVQQAVWYCYTRKQAMEMIRSSSGTFREELMASLEGRFLEDTLGRDRKFVITDKFRKEIEADDIRGAEKAVAWELYRAAQRLKEREPKEARRPLSIACTVCKGPIKAGQKYYGLRFGHKSYRAHVKCTNKVKKPR